MRPHGEFRLALAQALSSEPATCREIAQRARVSLDAARVTLDNMVRSGSAVKAEPTRVPGVSRPVPRYAQPPREQAGAFVREGLASETAQSSRALGAALGGWWGRR